MVFTIEDGAHRTDRPQLFEAFFEAAGGNHSVAPVYTRRACHFISTSMVYITHWNVAGAVKTEKYIT